MVLLLFPGFSSSELMGLRAGCPAQALSAGGGAPGHPSSSSGAQLAGSFNRDRKTLRWPALVSRSQAFDSGTHCGLFRL